jgi:hypothetical protein
MFVHFIALQISRVFSIMIYTVLSQTPQSFFRVLQCPSSSYTSNQLLLVGPVGYLCVFEWLPSLLIIYFNCALRYKNSACSNGSIEGDLLW